MFRIMILLIVAVTSIFAMSQKELAVALDYSMRQSVRCQKIIKEALLINLGIEPKKNAQRMKFTIKVLNKDLNAFLGRGKQNYKNGIKLPKIKDKKIISLLQEFENFWRPIEKKANKINSLKNINKEDIEFLLKQEKEFFKKSQAIVDEFYMLTYKDINKLKLAKDIKVAGELRNLTQIISKDILMFISGIEKSEVLKDLKKISKANKSFNALLNGDKELGCKGVKLHSITKHLKNAQKKWSEAKPLIAKVLRKKDKNSIKNLIADLDLVRISMRKSLDAYSLSIDRQKEFLALNKIISNFEHREQKTKNLVNLAGKQRMLTQRIAKLAIECSKDLRKDSCISLDEDMKLYSNILNLFDVGSKKLTIEPKFFTKARGQIAKLKELWKPFKDNVYALLRDKKDTKALDYILKNNEDLLKESDNLVKLLLKYNSNSKNYIKQEMLRVVNIAGKERMLIQKMTKELLEYKILNKQEKQKEMKKSIETFDLILRVLFSGNSTLKIPKVTNLEIKKQLQKVSMIWSKLKPNYLKDNISDKKLHLILIANPIVLKETDKAVIMAIKATEY